MNNIDRGGLGHVSDNTFMLFFIMETELRKHLQLCNVSDSVNMRKLAVDNIANNEEVVFFWSLLSSDWQEEEAAELLGMVIEHWVTIRGFSFASAFMEKYKQEKQKTTQKSKGIRKTLCATKTEKSKEE